MDTMKGYKTPYEVLGLTDGASIQEIKDTYRRLCLQHHPDLCAEHLRPAAETYFKDISAAYTVLTRRGGTEATTRGAWSSQAYRAAAGKASRSGSARYSNGVVGAVIAAPLVLLGIWVERKSSGAPSERLDPRPHGLLHPPINPYLRDDLKPRTYSRLWSNGPSRRVPRNGQSVGAQAGG